MDERLAALSDRVARAADALLADPLDAGVYGRPALEEPTGDPDAAATCSEALPPVETQPDEVLDGLADQSPVQLLGVALRGDNPQQVLGRLRGTPPAS